MRRGAFELSARGRAVFDTPDALTAWAEPLKDALYAEGAPAPAEDVRPLARPTPPAAAPPAAPAPSVAADPRPHPHRQSPQTPPSRRIAPPRRIRGGARRHGCDRCA